jgi:hypothetical protein
MKHFFPFPFILLIVLKDVVQDNPNADIVLKLQFYISEPLKEKEVEPSYSRANLKRKAVNEARNVPQVCLLFCDKCR